MALSRSKTEAWRTVLANEIPELITAPRDAQMAMTALVARDAFYDGVIDWLKSGKPDDRYRMFHAWQAWLVEAESMSVANIDGLLFALVEQASNASVHQIAEYKAYFDRWKAAKRKARDDQDWLVWQQYTGVVELIDEGSSPKIDFTLLATSDSTQGRIEAFSRMVPLVAAERGGGTDLVWQPWIEWQRAEEKDRQLWESL